MLKNALHSDDTSGRRQRREIRTDIAWRALCQVPEVKVARELQPAAQHLQDSGRE